MSNHVKKYYLWNELRKDVEEFIRNFDDCKRYKQLISHTEPMTITSMASSAF